MVITLLTQPPQDADICYSDINTSNIMVSRRKRVWRLRKKILPWKSLSIYPNLNEPIDSTLRLIQFCKPHTKEPLALLWNMACHPIMYHSPKHLSGHFPADIRAHLRKKNDIPILFLQGFTGNIRPKNIQRPRSLQERLETKTNQSPPFQVFSKDTYASWLKKITPYLDILICQTAQPLDKQTLSIRQYQCLLETIWDGACHKQTLHFQAIYLNKNTVILGISAEIVSAYSLQLQKKFPGITLIPAGYMGSVFGYWPTQKMVADGGYEVSGFKKGFSLNGQFKGTLEQCFHVSIRPLLT